MRTSPLSEAWAKNIEPANEIWEGVEAIHQSASPHVKLREDVKSWVMTAFASCVSIPRRSDIQVLHYSWGAREGANRRPLCLYKGGWGHTRQTHARRGVPSRHSTDLIDSVPVFRDILHTQRDEVRKWLARKEMHFRKPVLSIFDRVATALQPFWGLGLPEENYMVPPPTPLSLRVAAPVECAGPRVPDSSFGDSGWNVALTHTVRVLGAQVRADMNDAIDLVVSSKRVLRLRADCAPSRVVMSTVMEDLKRTLEEARLHIAERSREILRVHDKIKADLSWINIVKEL